MKPDGTKDGNVPEYRIDELARRSGVAVRNIRYYQDRGMLPAPRREGRVGIYTDAHLARLRLITRLLERSYTAANITELLNAWERGRDLAEVLGLEQAVTGNLDEELPELVSEADLRTLFGADGTGERAPQLVDKAVAVTIIERAAEPGAELNTDGYRVPSPRLLRATAELVASGAPLDATLQLAGQISQSLDNAIREFVVALAEEIFADRDEDWMPASDEIADLSGMMQRLKPLTSAAAAAVVSGSLARHLDAVLGDYVARVLPTLHGDAFPDSPASTAS
jgi:DNA-binding transcriptional MerR regulator